MTTPPQRTGEGLPPTQQQWLLNAILLPAPQAREAAHAWLSTVDIDAIEQASMRLLPLLYDRLRELGIDHPLLPLLKGIKKRAWFLNSVLMRRAGDALRVLNQAGIEAMALKGVALTLAYYRDVSLRPMGDVDLMVRPEAASAAIETLCAAGWTLEPGRFASPQFFERVRRYSHAINLVHPSGQTLDLHWNLLPYSTTAGDEFWDASSLSEIDGHPVRLLSPTHELLHVCAHGAAWNEVSPIRWIPDALTVLRSSPPIDWDGLVSQARKSRLTLMLGGTLDYLQHHFPADVPSTVGSQLRQPRPTLLERVEYRQLRRPTTGLLGYVPRKLCKFRRIAQGKGLASTAHALPDYICWACNVERIRQLPAIFARRIAQRMQDRRYADPPSTGPTLH